MPAKLITGSRIIVFFVLSYLITAGDILSSFTKFAPVPQTVFLVCLLIFILLRKQIFGILNYINRIPDKIFIPITISAAFCIIATAAVVVLEKIPHVTDSVAYLWQAKAMANGMFTIPTGNMPEFYMPHFYYQENGQMISLFQPGWPLVLAIGVLLKAEFLVNPLLGALTLWPSYNIFKRLFGQKTARLALLIILLSPFYLFMSASFMAHTLSGLLAMTAIDRALAYKNNGKIYNIVIIGACTGFLFCVRAYNSILLLIPLSTIFVPLLLGRKIPLKIVFIGIVAGLPFFSSQLAVNHYLTGSITSFPQDKYFELTEEISTCHRIGFGEDVGCINEHGRYGFPEGYYLKEAIQVTKQRLLSLSLNFYGTPIALIILLIPILAMKFRQNLIIIYSIPLNLILGYMLFYYHGNCYGPRFYYEAISALGLLMALGFENMHNGLVKVAAVLPKPKSFLLAWSPALLLTLFVFSAGWMHPRLWDTYSRLRNIDGNVKQIVEKAGITNAVIIMPGTRSSLGEGFNNNSPYMDTDIIYARHIYDQSIQLMYQYPEKDFYIFDAIKKRIVKIKKLPFEGMIYIEADSKTPPSSIYKGFAKAGGISLYRNGDKNTEQLYFRGQQANSSFTFEQYIFEEGDYQIELESLKGPFMSNWSLEVNGRRIGEIFKGYNKKYYFVFWKSTKTIHLKKGMSSFKFVAISKDEKSRDYGIGIDWMLLRKIPDALGKPIPRIIIEGYFEDDKFIETK